MAENVKYGFLGRVPGGYKLPSTGYGGHCWAEEETPVQRLGVASAGVCWLKRQEGWLYSVLLKRLSMMGSNGGIAETKRRGAQRKAAANRLRQAVIWNFE